MVKHLALGAGLIFFAVFLSPAPIDPIDLALTPTLVAMTHAMFGELGLVVAILWIALGYVSLIFGVLFVGHSLTKYIPHIRGLHFHTSYILSHPFKVSFIIFGIAIAISVYILRISGQI